MPKQITLTDIEFQTLQNVLKKVNAIKFLPTETEVKEAGYTSDEHMLIELYEKFEL